MKLKLLILALFSLSLSAFAETFVGTYDSVKPTEAGGVHLLTFSSKTGESKTITFPDGVMGQRLYGWDNGRKCWVTILLKPNQTIQLTLEYQ